MLAFKPHKLNEYSQAIHEQALAAASRYLVAESEVLAAIIRIDKDQTYRKLGYDHLTPYCVKELKISDEVAGTFVRVARKCHEVPKLVVAVDGGLNLTKAKTIVSVITRDNQDEWINKALTLSKAKLEKEVSIRNPQPVRREKAKPVGENRYRIEFELNDEFMEMQRRVLELVSSKLRRPATLADAQQFLLKNFIKHEDPVAKADRAKPRKNQKNSKSIPAAVRHAVFKRDRGCCQARLPSGDLCLRRRWVDMHHIILKSRGGPDTPENLVTLCSSHHGLWHDRNSDRPRSSRGRNKASEKPSAPPTSSA